MPQDLSRLAVPGLVQTLAPILALPLALLTATASAVAAPLPEIRTSPANTVPACATPAALDAFARSRNPDIAQRFRRLGTLYRSHGERLRVRWDYAYFQMLVETNFLSFKRPSGKPGDVSVTQNNFAGMGATGGGVPGDSYPDTATGVRAQLEHLVVYSGERLANPVAPRTQLKMDEILAKSQALGRRVTFADLSGRWAVDRGYGASIDGVAREFADRHCRSQPAVASANTRPPATKVAASVAPAAPAPQSPPQVSGASHPTERANLGAAVERPATAPQRTASKTVVAAAPAPPPRQSAPAAATKCNVLKAAFATSNKGVLLQAKSAGSTTLTALGVAGGRERDQARAYLDKHAPDGTVLGTFSSQDAALRRAFELCPSK
jgi:hypothetical protein